MCPPGLLFDDPLRGLNMTSANFVTVYITDNNDIIGSIKNRGFNNLFFNYCNDIQPNCDYNKLCNHEACVQFYVAQVNNDVEFKFTKCTPNDRCAPLNDTLVTAADTNYGDCFCASTGPCYPYDIPN